MSGWVAGAVVVGAVVSSNAAGKAASTQADATRQASEAQAQSQSESIAFQQRQADQARADQAPWRAAGEAALGKLTAVPDFTGASLQSSPGYQFGLSEGMKGVTNSAAARGGLLSGAALKAASRYNSDYAGTKFNDAFNQDAANKNRLASIAGVGQTAAGQMANSSNALGSNVGNGMINTGNQIAGNTIGAGNARASGYLAQGNALTGAINQGVSAWNNYNQPSYSSWQNNNSGVMNSTGLSAAELGSAF